MISSIISEKIDIMHLWNEAGVLHNAKDILDKHRFHRDK